MWVEVAVLGSSMHTHPLSPRSRSMLHEGPPGLSSPYSSLDNEQDGESQHQHQEGKHKPSNDSSNHMSCHRARRCDVGRGRHAR